MKNKIKLSLITTALLVGSLSFSTVSFSLENQAISNFQAIWTKIRYK